MVRGQLGYVLRVAFGDFATSAEQIVEFVVRAYPGPSDGIATTLAYGAVLFVDADGPDMLVAAKFLESEGRMLRIVREERISAARCQPIWLT